MNRSSLGLETGKCIQGFLQFKSAEGLSKGTIATYQRDLEKWVEYQGEMVIGQVTQQHLRQYLSYMLSEYQPHRLSGRNDTPLSPKTVRNIWVTLSAFFHWASEEFDLPNPMKKVPPPKFERKPVEPLTREEIESLLQVCDYSQEAATTIRKKFTMRRPSSYRDKAIILTLLDSGLRASELCALKIGALDIKTGKVIVQHGVAGGAKGRKGRFVYLGKTARKSVWRYLASREDGEDADAPMFLGKFGRPMTKDTLRQVISALGEKAGIKGVHPHRFRHTFAITYLRSGGDLFTLQSMLGHSSLDMVQYYARIAEIDVEQAHHRASPADNWRL
jgi:integrase/recombinase XerD